MKTADPSERLRQLILLRKEEQLAEGELLKDHFHLFYESLKPVNIIKRTFKEIVSGQSLKTDVVDLALGLTSGFIARKVFSAGSNNPFLKLSGMIVEMVVASKATKNAEEIKAIGGIVLKTIIRKFSKTEKAVQ